MKQFLIQIMMEDGTGFNKLVNETEVIKLTNNSDFNGIADMKVFAIKGFGNVIPLEYKGWQSNCLIQYVDADGNVLVDGYGDDH